MTNPFSAFAFKAAGSGVTTDITLPDRLSYRKNVKDFGATGNGVTDDLAAIMAAFNWTASTNKGTIFFPPGTYRVSAPINIGPVDNIIVNLVGVIGASTIVGAFADYVIKKANSTPGNPSVVENLNVINTDANGGGIRLGGCVGAAIRNCTVTAHRGINNSQDDTGSAGATSLECSIENCIVGPGSNTSGSIGIMSVADGPIFNCRVVGFEIGMVLWGQEGAHYIAGCYFEGNQIAFKPGFRPDGVADNDAGYTITGCRFKNNGTALYLQHSAGSHLGLRIEADEAVTVYGARPQYGVRMFGTAGFFAGIIATGQYDQYAISVETETAGSTARPYTQFFAVNAFNTSSHGGVAWLRSTTPQTASFNACNCAASVYSVADLPAIPIGINTAAWSGGTTTLSMFANMGPFVGSTITMVVSGVTPSGYNGTFSGITVTGVNTVQFSQSNPGSPIGSGGTAVTNVNSAAKEGDCYNVSDANTATWGAAALGGGGSNHVKLRYTPAAWTVVGK